MERKNGLFGSHKLRHGRDIAVLYFIQIWVLPLSGSSTAKMQMAVSRDARQMTDSLASGKFSICIRCTTGGEVGRGMQHGPPIDYLDTEDWKEGSSSSAAGGTLGLPSRAPHPNAAKVFINWFLSREGQIALQKLGRPDAHNSRRIDIPKDDVDPYNRLGQGKRYFDLARPEYQDLTPIFKLVKEVLPQK